MMGPRQGVCTAIAAILAGLPIAATCDQPAAIAGEANGVVNVTSDSAPGWLPSKAQQQEASDAARDYLAARDSGRFADAYAMWADVMRQQQTFAAASDAWRSFNDAAGAVAQRRLVMTTWTKDSANAPSPGVYAAVDLVSRFARVDRHCGYLVLYQPPAGGSFRVMREEEGYMTNATAEDIRRRQSPAAVDAAWAQITAHCPNYSYADVDQGPLPEQSGDIGYASVAAALAALKARKDVKVSGQHGWMVFEDNATKTIWSFAPPGDAAYPAAVKRRIVQSKSAVYIEMSVACEASKLACDNLVRQFEALNAQVSASMR